MQLIEFSPGEKPTEVDPHEALESGNILYFPHEGSGLSEQDRRFLLSIRQANGALHKNIAYRPLEDRLSGHEQSGSGSAQSLQAALRSYSEWAIQFTGKVLPRYPPHWRLDYASFRPQEEEGRDLPWKKRNDLLHVDAFPSRPTKGDMILRVFTNLNSEQKRVWLTSDPFAELAPKYALAAGLSEISAHSDSGMDQLRRGSIRTLRSLGLPLADRSAYDRFMLGFHDYLKGNAEYQRDCPKYRFEFPPNTTWMVFTDVVPHAVLSGRFAIEQTFIIARSSLANPSHAPASILETLSGKALTN
ncbi:MAG: Kdo hydroxylase family protein [Acidobacteriota bacterium]|nr:Kdo hydroxylase family protein [Acidobacteriota bacterium]